MSVRPATTADLPAVKGIYDEHVLGSLATFETVPPPLSYWVARLESPDRGDHFLVAVDGDRVVGYAYSSAYRPRPAYAHTRETSVYLSADAAGRGLGRALYDELLARLTASGVHTAVAVVALPNPASQALHRACGFTPVGVLRDVGRKFDRWIDTELWQRPIGG